MRPNIKQSWPGISVISNKGYIAPRSCLSVIALGYAGMAVISLCRPALLILFYFCKFKYTHPKIKVHDQVNIT